MSNERVTEGLFRGLLEGEGYYKSEQIKVYEQKSPDVTITRLLRTAGKSGMGGKGSPEFIVTSSLAPDFVVLVECKADVSNQRSADLDKPVQFALDGAIHYARSLASRYNVIAVGVSGQNLSELRQDYYLVPKGTLDARPLMNRYGNPVTELLPFAELVEAGAFDPVVAKRRTDDLMDFSRELHNFMREHAKLTESEKPLLVSGTLIALQNPIFAKTYGDYDDPSELQSQWFSTIEVQIEKAKIPDLKVSNMTTPYRSLSVHPELSKPSEKWPRGPLYELIYQLHQKVMPFISEYHDFDVVGQFYGEFLKYTGGDKKSLGIVLTPRHVTELFGLLANVDADSKVLDPAAGTGGFLISAMTQMLKQAQSEQKRVAIKQRQLIGVEQQPNMFALAASNMMLRGDGKANLYQGDCFAPKIADAMKSHHCDVGMINPPYSQKDPALHELAFVDAMLDALKPKGVGLAIVPITCASAPHKLKAQILSKHTLEAVMSMPNDLFSPVGVITCVMVFTAHKPHALSNRSTWLARWPDDGFVKTKHLGRVDLHGKWPTIRDRWVDEFKERRITDRALTRKVGADEEWCAEAYLPTNYDLIEPRDVERELRNMAVFKLLCEAL